MVSAFRCAAERSGGSHDTLDMVGVDVVEEAEAKLFRTCPDCVKLMFEF